MPVESPQVLDHHAVSMLFIHESFPSPVGTHKSDRGQNATAGGSSFCLYYFLFIFDALPINKYF